MYYYACKIDSKPNQNLSWHEHLIFGFACMAEPNFHRVRRSCGLCLWGIIHLWCWDVFTLQHSDVQWSSSSPSQPSGLPPPSSARGINDWKQIQLFPEKVEVRRSGTTRTSLVLPQRCIQRCGMGKKTCSGLLAFLQTNHKRHGQR